MNQHGRTGYKYRVPVIVLFFIAPHFHIAHKRQTTSQNSVSKRLWTRVP